MAGISNPTSLATFQNARASSSKLSHVALSGVSGSDGSLAVAAVSGEGVWTYDVSDMGYPCRLERGGLTGSAGYSSTDDVVRGPSVHYLFDASAELHSREAGTSSGQGEAD